MEGMWLSAEIKFDAVVVLNESATHLMGELILERWQNDIAEYIRRVQCACCFNIAMCKFHRGKLHGNKMDKSGVQQRWTDMDMLGSLSALEFCHYGNLVCSSVMGKIKTSIILEAMDR